jgi:hypothetical protein
MAKNLVGLGIAGSLVAVALLAQASERPLSRLETEKGKVGWDGISLGMSSVQVERHTGVTLAMQPNASSAAGGSCRAYTVTVERGTLLLTLGFPSPKPGAKLQSIFVNFEGYQVAAKPDALVAELKEKFPQAVYLPQRGDAPPAESADPTPTYLLPGGYAARLVPGGGLWITLRDCLN